MPPLASLPTESALNRRRANLEQTSTVVAHKHGSVQPASAQAPSIFQAPSTVHAPSSVHAPSTIHDREAAFHNVYHRRTRELIQYYERKRQERERAASLRKQKQLLQQSQGRVKQEKIFGGQLLSGLFNKIRRRFPGRPEKAERFLAIMGSGTPTRDLLPDVADLLRTAPELVQDFQTSMSDIDATRFPQPQPEPEPEPEPQPETQPRRPRSSPIAPQRNPRGRGDLVNDGASSSVGGGRALPRPQASAESQNQHLQKFLKLPEIEIPRDKRMSKPPGMSCELLEHQKVGLTWLVQQEEDQHKKGGILADTMGLGKTIQALALILARPSTNPTSKTTLIVAPLALLKQWEREIQQKVKPQYKLKTLIFHGPAKRGVTVAKLLTYDVVLTTYGTVTWDNKTRDLKKRIILGKDALFHRVILDEAHNIKNRSGMGSLAVCKIQSTYRLCMTGTPFMNNTEEIFSLIHFLRIKPYDSWVRYNNDIHRPIKRGRGDEPEAAMKKLQTLFRTMTLRRTKTSMLDGKPIIELPELVREVAVAEFNEEQGAFYAALEQRQQLKVNEFTKAGTLMRRYTYVLVLLLRLRQACCHPHLIKDFGIPERARLSADEMRQLSLKLKKETVERLKGQKEFECPFCNEMTEAPLIISPCGHTICSSCFSALVEVEDPNAEIQVPCPNQGCDSQFDPETVICHCFFMEVHSPESLESDNDNSDDDSDGFESLPDDSDDEVDARGNLKGFVVSDEEEEDEYDDSESDDEPRREVSEEKESDKEPDKESDREEPPEDSDDDSLASTGAIWKKVTAMRTLRKGNPVASQKRKSTSNSISDVDLPEKKPAASNDKRKRASTKNTQRPQKKIKKNNGTSKKSRKGKGVKFTSLAVLKKASSTNASAKAKYLKQLRKDYVPSAKINKTMELLCAIREKDSQEKTLVFSLWTSFLDLLEIPMQDQGFRYARYDGSMRQSDRDAVVQKFMDTGDIDIMLVSLSAGNAGLNLTAATQVIILEPFWNPFVEEQAIDRTHRIGQKKNVTVHRILIAGTVEDRICKLQEQKRELVTTALSEEGAKGVSQLTLRQLRGLFGLK
ncbi:hypothetical protein F5Y05DRAFT_213007 [Hypoxylon sp. FL0543]|nr:hypothetical protein F5Y05DRAFT_213007 [Hypoxylon sp. FL0543]